jgi:hypothetical protein
MRAAIDGRLEWRQLLRSNAGLPVTGRQPVTKVLAKMTSISTFLNEILRKTIIIYIKNYKNNDY